MANWSNGCGYGGCVDHGHHTSGHGGDHNSNCYGPQNGHVMAAAMRIRTVTKWCLCKWFNWLFFKIFSAYILLTFWYFGTLTPLMKRHTLQLMIPLGPHANPLPFFMGCLYHRQKETGAKTTKTKRRAKVFKMVLIVEMIKIAQNQSLP